MGQLAMITNIPARSGGIRFDDMDSDVNILCHYLDLAQTLLHTLSAASSSLVRSTGGKLYYTFVTYSIYSLIAVNRHSV